MASRTRTDSTYSPEARKVISLLSIALGLLLVLVCVVFIRADTAADKAADAARKAADTAEAVAEQSQCNTDWKAAFRKAQAPRVAASTAQLESLRLFYKRIRTLTNGPLYPTTPERVASRMALDKAITDAYNDVVGQLNANKTNAYPSDDCGHTTGLDIGDLLDPLPKKETSDERDSDEAPVVGGGSSGNNSSGADCPANRRARATAHGNCPGSGNGGGGVHPRPGDNAPGLGTEGATRFLCVLLNPVLDGVRVAGRCVL